MHSIYCGHSYTAAAVRLYKNPMLLTGDRDRPVNPLGMAIALLTGGCCGRESTRTMIRRDSSRLGRFIASRADS